MATPYLPELSKTIFGTKLQALYVQALRAL